MSSTLGEGVGGSWQQDTQSIPEGYHGTEREAGEEGKPSSHTGAQANMDSQDFLSPIWLAFQVCPEMSCRSLLGR